MTPIYRKETGPEELGASLSGLTVLPEACGPGQRSGRPTAQQQGGGATVGWCHCISPRGSGWAPPLYLPPPTTVPLDPGEAQ